MIKQEFPTQSKAKKETRSAERSHVWEVRHAGLLGIKYEVAVRGDLFEEQLVKGEDEDQFSGEDILKGVVDAAVLG
jgi:TATA-binding protein-associated factor